MRSVKKVELIELLKNNGTNPYPNPKTLTLNNLHVIQW